MLTQRATFRALTHVAALHLGTGPVSASTPPIIAQTRVIATSQSANHHNTICLMACQSESLKHGQSYFRKAASKIGKPLANQSLTDKAEFQA
jgi:hypothetical protein